MRWRTVLMSGIFVLFVSGAANGLGVDEINRQIAALPSTTKGLKRGTLYMELGRELYRTGKMKEAAQAYETALTYDTSRKMRRTIYLYLAKSYESSQQDDKATWAYEQALARDKRNWRRHRDLGLRYELAGRYDDAVARYQRALDYSPGKALVMWNLGRVYRKMGLLPDAESWLLKAKEAGHRSADVSEELSYVYEQQGRFSEAFQAWAGYAGYGVAPLDQLVRFVYLAVLANDPVAARKSLRRLTSAGGAKETALFYENLVQWRTQHPDAALLGKIPNAIRDWLFSTAGL